jgi:hypothetical protein
MASKIDPIFMNGSNYAVWAPDMESLLKSKGLWQYMKDVIPYPIDNQEKFTIDGKKYEVVGVITTYILWEIQFHFNGIDCPHQVWKKLKLLFEGIDKIHVMQLEKELISLDPHSFERMDDYLLHVKELQLELGKFGKNH